MKKSVMIVVVAVFMIPAVYAQTGEPIRYGSMLDPRGNTLRVQLSIEYSANIALLAVDFEGKINGKPIEFDQVGRTAVMNDGSLSDDEFRLVENGLDMIGAALNGDKLEMPEMSIELKAEGSALLVNVKSRRGGAVFEGKLEVGVAVLGGEGFKLNPLEFKQDAAGAVIVNNRTLSDYEVVALMRVSGTTKYWLGMLQNMNDLPSMSIW